ncbi:MAG: MBL fold metallo-hydrolase [Candidatus Aminicenantes bacterium]|jgi:glyoxylase-like metal-dependent hydrolase (beta-lactamase superfamily II)|nr:MBL fold metallo-hydrolase [Candidatus Aminicenantes bacterium]
MTPLKITLGQFDIYGLRDGYFYLDGGAMFGVVPKTLWAKMFPADESNRIQMGLNSILIKTDLDLILVDTGVGSLIPPKFHEYYAIERDPDLVDSLKEIGIFPDEITFVINTHLHFDHCGGNTRKNAESDIVPTFPNAKYVIQKGEWEYALDPHSRDKVSYFSDTFLPLRKHGQLRLVDGDEEIVSGVSVVLMPGHTSFHQGVKAQSGGETLVFFGDMVPTSAHLGLGYIASYDLFPVTTLDTKVAFFEKAVKENWIIALDHDPVHYFGRIKKAKDKYTFEPLQS